jgi:hypothetical protein
MSSLRYLSLIRTRVTDGGLIRLEGHKTLEMLNLDFTQITDAGLARMNGLPSLKQLSLGHTKVTDAGLVSLKGLAGILRLDLSRTQVTDAGLTSLRRALPQARVEFDRMARGDPSGESEFITYLSTNGIVAERDFSSWSDSWRVVRPATKNYSVEFVMIFFPPEATEQQMSHELIGISLGTMLNAPAHLAMSYPFYRAAKPPDSGFPILEQNPTRKRLIELFRRYDRASAGSRKALP